MGQRVGDHARRGRERDPQVARVRDQSRVRRGRRRARRGPRGQPCCLRLLEPGASPPHTLPLGWPADGLGQRPPALVRAPAPGGARRRRFRRAHAHRVQRPGRLQVHARGAGRLLERVDASAFVFAMHEPDGYPPANDMVIAEAGGRRRAAVPVLPARPARLPARRAAPLPRRRRPRDQVPPARRGLQPRPPGAPGRVRPRRRGARCPILCHAGRGIPALGRHSIEVCARHPGLRLILAHAGISDLAWIWREAPAHPNLFFDTVVVVAQRHPGAVRARPARPDPHGQRRPLRHAGVRGDDGDAPRAPGRPRAGRAARRARAPRRAAWSSASTPLDLGPPPATRRSRATR